MYFFVILGIIYVINKYNFVFGFFNECNGKKVFLMEKVVENIYEL